MKRITIVSGLIIVLASVLAYFYFDDNKKYSKCICEHKSYDKEDYLLKICRYVIENQLDVSPADPCNYHIKHIENTKIKNKEVVIV